MRTIFFLLLSLCMLNLPLSASAEETPALSQISVLDSSGFARAAGEVNGTGSVEFSLTDAAGAPAEGIEVTLTNQATGEVLKAVSSAGKVVFENVAAGTWTVASSANGVVFTAASVTGAAGAAAAGGMGLTAGLLTGAGAIGAATAIDASVVDQDDDTPLSPAS